MHRSAVGHLAWGSPRRCVPPTLAVPWVRCYTRGVEQHLGQQQQQAAAAAAAAASSSSSSSSRSSSYFFSTHAPTFFAAEQQQAAQASFSRIIFCRWCGASPIADWLISWRVFFPENDHGTFFSKFYVKIFASPRPNSSTSFGIGSSEGNRRRQNKQRITASATRSSSGWFGNVTFSIHNLDAWPIILPLHDLCLSQHTDPWSIHVYSGGSQNKAVWLTWYTIGIFKPMELLMTPTLTITNTKCRSKRPLLTSQWCHWSEMVETKPKACITGKEWQSHNPSSPQREKKQIRIMTCMAYVMEARVVWSAPPGVKDVRRRSVKGKNSSGQGWKTRAFHTKTQ